MTDWDDLHRRARNVIPRRELKARRCWIGVLSHEKAPEDELEETDFIWMMGHSKIPVQTIYDTYQKRQNIQFRLTFKDKLVDQSEIIKSFLVPGDTLVLFHVRLPGSENPITGLQASQLEDAVRSSLVTRSKKVSTDGSMARVDSPTSTFRPTALKTNDSERSKTQHMVPSTTPIPANTPDGTTPAKQATMQSYGRDSSRQSDPSLKPDLTRLQFQCTTPSTEPYNPTYEPSSYNATQIPTSGHTSAPYPVGGPYIPPYNDTRISASSLTSVPHPVGVKQERHSPAPCWSPAPFQSAATEPAHQFDPEDVFKREPSPQVDDEEALAFKDNSVREIMEQQDVQVLEAGVARSMQILGELQQQFSSYSANTDAQAWIQSIAKLMLQAERKRTVVGVVGNTGAGKSSVINAMLDEERLVPTNCMRACTAVVTEISWNDSSDPSSKYRAEIEFIDREDWQKELETLMKELLTDNGTISREAQDPNSDAGIAWAKFHSVYPSVAKNCIGECTVSSLMSKSSVVDILGTTKKIRAIRPDRFYYELQRYVDSKEKVSKKANGKERDQNKNREKKQSFEMEYWPLIKVVKIYTKSSALSTGAVIVDLPGVQDSNAARAAVAQGYMKQCTGLWIVAPINRAVDDKAAKTLLGDSFKRQLKYDGGFDSVTFICSKTDDISITEAIDSLELEDKVTEYEEERDHHKEQIEQIKSRVANLRETQDVYKSALSQAADDIEVWEGLQEQLDGGEPVFAPSPKVNKRKKTGSSRVSKKKRYASEEDSDSDFITSDDDEGAGIDNDDDEEDDDEDVTFQAERTRLSETNIKDKLKELRKTTKNARREGTEIKSSIDEQRFQIREHQAKIVDVQTKLSQICIAGRNEYSKTAIQRDFAAGIKEIDQENAAEDEDNFNPDEELRDYDQVAQSLPVFCVSSRAYQKLCGRMKKDDDVPGFTAPEETEIPFLQEHCKRLTESGRIQTSRAFLMNLCQLLTTFNLWAANDGTGLKMSDNDKHKQVNYLLRRLKELEDVLEAAVRACINEMRLEMKTQIFDKCPDLIDHAIEAAPATAHAWGNKEKGGLLYSSYKAVVRRDGVFQSAAAGSRDFNFDLVAPIFKRLATGWERAFAIRLPKAFDLYIANVGKILHKFHEAVESRARENGVSLANVSVLKSQIHNYEQIFRDLGVVLLTQMTELQREANRDFTPTIATIMHSVYERCTDERGPGSYKRMKEHMTDHVERERHNMFRAAVRAVENHLESMCKALESSMETKVDEVFVQMKADYMRVLGGVASNQPIPLALHSTEKRDLRSQIRDILQGIDARFEPILNGDLGLEAAEAQVEEPTAVEEEDGSTGIFDDENQSSMDEVGDTVFTEATLPGNRRAFQAYVSDYNTDDEM